MSQYQRLLLITDAQMHHGAALQRAIALAEHSGAALHILALVEPLSAWALLDRDVQQRLHNDHLQALNNWLKDETGLLHSKGLTATFEILSSDQPLEEILQHARELPADLLIKDLQHESALKRAFVTPLDWQLLRDCPAPVHLLSAAGPALPRKVVAAVDLQAGNPDSLAINQQVIAQAHALALQCDAELHLLHSYDLSTAYLAEAGAVVSAWADLVEQWQNGLLQAFTTLAEQHGVPAECRHFIQGQPIRTLVEFATQQQVDVLVMGRVQRHGLGRLLGSTTEHLLYRAPCSILAIAL